MFGLLLRSELLQGSALRTWNCVLNIANFFRYRFTNFRQPVMPRLRRRHHSRSRSRSRSHSHDRDREVKRRRVESPDSHHRRSVSPETESTNEKIVSPVPVAKSISNTSNDDDNKISAVNEHDETVSKDNGEDLIEKTNVANETLEIEKTSTPKDVKKCQMETTELNETTDTVEETDDTKLDEQKTEEEQDEEEDEEEVDLTKDNGDAKEHPSDLNTSNKILNTTIESENKTPKKVLSPAQKRKQEEKFKLRQEREEQRLKERKEKEEQKRREREEKELQKRKEREEKEEQKRKEREEKEEQKRKEREEKELLKKKEKEEKEEQKRKEREERELKKQQEIDEKNRGKKKKEQKLGKEAAAFVNFFSRKSTGSSEPKREDEKQTYAFMPFEVKADMRLAPLVRIDFSPEQKNALIEKLTNQHEIDVLYLDELKRGKKINRSSRTYPVENEGDDVVIVEETDLGECVDEEKPKLEKMRTKFLYFCDNRRPAYFGTWRKKSSFIKPRRPLGLDKAVFDYEIDSDDDWEEEESGESLQGSDDEKENEPEDDYDIDNQFMVPHGYLSDEEVDGEEAAEGDDGENREISAETKKEKLKLQQEEFTEEMKSKTQRIKPRLIGCIWENKLIPKVQDSIHKFLNERMMIVAGTITIQKRNLLSANVKITASSKVGTPHRRTLDKELIPEFLNLIHGNTNNQTILANEFINYLTNKGIDITISKAAVCSQLKKLAKWQKCPEEGNMFNKLCWYVDEDIRNQYNVTIELPNKWVYTNVPDESVNAKKKLAD